MSKGSKQRPGTGYRENWERIFRKHGKPVETEMLTTKELEIILFPPDDKSIRAIEPTPKSRKVA